MIRPRTFVFCCWKSSFEIVPESRSDFSLMSFSTPSPGEMVWPVPDAFSTVPGALAVAEEADCPRVRPRNRYGDGHSAGIESILSRFIPFYRGKHAKKEANEV